MVKGYRKYFKNRKGRIGRPKSLLKAISTFKRSNQSQIFKMHALCWQPIDNETETAQTLRSSYMFNYPGYYLNNAGSYGEIDHLPPDLKRAFQFFHEYRVISMKVRFEPQSVDVSASDTDAPNSVYMNPDYSDYNLLNDSLALNAGIAPKAYANGRTVSRSMKNRTNTRKQWMQTATVSHGPEEGTDATNDQTVVANSYGAIKCLWSLVPGNYAVGRMYIEYNIIFRGLALNQANP